ISYISTPTISYQQLDILSAGRCLVSIKNGEIENIFNKDEVVFVSNYPEIMKEEIIDLINDKERIARTALNGRIAVRELDWDKTLSNICNFIETI
ncbi:glycosyltransferase, partial [Yersinia enterocolitica]|nr:glycosyltransferase [Yersinia enterocolitica]